MIGAYDLSVTLLQCRTTVDGHIPLTVTAMYQRLTVHHRRREQPQWIPGSWCRTLSSALAVRCVN